MGFEPFFVMGHVLPEGNSRAGLGGVKGGGPPHARPAARKVFAVGLLFNISPNLDVLAGESTRAMRAI